MGRAGGHSWAEEVMKRLRKSGGKDDHLPTLQMLTIGLVVHSKELAPLIRLPPCYCKPQIFAASCKLSNSEFSVVIRSRSEEV
jgi:hypothetical protein